MGIMHGDINPENILYYNGIYIIIDFSHSINFYELGGIENIRLTGGTYAFCSPSTKNILDNK